jgi:hypothetical protein
VLESLHFVYHRERCRTNKIGRRGNGIQIGLGDLERRGEILVMLDLRFPVAVSHGYRRLWS